MVRRNIAGVDKLDVEPIQLNLPDPAMQPERMLPRFIGA
jgi:hypothetical protein